MPVYFVQAGEGGPVKIGWAVDVARRVVELQTGHYQDLSLLRVVEGERAVESWFHRRFAAQRIRGEWFRFDQQLLTEPAPGAVVPQPASTGFAAIIDALGGSGSFAKVIGRSLGTASAMRTRNVIPAVHWGAVVRGATARGLTTISLKLLSQLYASRHRENLSKRAA